MTLTQRGSSLYEAKLARPIEELRQNGVTIQIILDADYLLVERKWNFQRLSGYELAGNEIFLRHGSSGDWGS